VAANAHPAYRSSLDRLHSAGVHIVMTSSNDLEAFDHACIAAATWIETNRIDSAS
jgi:hypothetical protein